MKFRHHRLLLFLLLFHAAQFFGGLLRLALGHSTLDVGGGKYPGGCRLRCAATLGHDLPPFPGTFQFPSCSRKKPPPPLDAEAEIGQEEAPIHRRRGEKRCKVRCPPSVLKSP